MTISTLDFDRRLKPDVEASVLNIPFKDNSFQVVACYELLEHIPYEYLSRSLSEIKRISAKYIILSLPDASRVYPIYIHIPKIRDVKKLVPWPQLRKPIHRFDGEHYWEIGKDGYSLRRILNDIYKQGLLLEKTYRVYEIPYHRFFVCQKS